ncbi:MAG: XRE family transcriptional regulator [Bacillota bacterium]
MIGARIRNARRERGWTIKQLADRTGLTPSFLSQVERDVASPSINSLQRIAEAFTIPTFYLLLDVDGGSPVVRRAERRQLKHPGVTVPYELLCPSSACNLEVAIGRLPPGMASSDQFLTHDGEECVLVLEGSMQAMLGHVSYFLEVGDSILLSSLVPHRFLNIGSEELVFLVAMTPRRHARVGHLVHSAGEGRAD